jgi:pimeloyl-ACP methyl ester carboxylesterase
MTKFRKRFIGLAALVAVFFLSAAAGWAAIDPSTVQKLVAGDGAASDDKFGSSISVDGNTAVIGARGQNDNGEYSGAVYVFVRGEDGTWTHQAKLLPNDGAANDYFGESVSVSGNTAVIGAGDDDDNGNLSGSAYVFVRNGSGVWTQQAKLLPNDGAASDYFGQSVSVSGNTAVIGADQDDNYNGTNSGSVYVFVRNGSGEWIQQAKLLPNDGAAYGYFGYSVSVFGDTAVIGALGFFHSAYVFVHNESGGWIQQAKLLPDNDGSAHNYFGISVSVSGDTAVIGADRDDDNGNSSGSAYVFVRNGSGVWTQQTKLLPNDGAASDYFGSFVSVSGEIAVISAHQDDNDTGFGSAYVFVRNGSGGWIQQAKLLPNNEDAYFGRPISVSGDTAIIGAYGADNKGSSSGLAYVYSSTPTTSNVAVTVTTPTSGTTYNHGNQVTINWQTENADPADTMVLSMKRDSASDMAAPDNRSWYRFTENTPNDGTETVTIPDSVVAASDWRFYVRHVSSGEYAASGIVELAEAENIGQLYIEKSGDGLGTVSRAIPGRRPQTLCDIDSTSQVHRFPVGATVGITAEADTNSVFSGWEGCDLVVDEQCYITVNDYEEVSAQFNAAEDATVELSVSFFDQPYEQGSVVSDPPGISCSDSKGTCRAKFVPGQTVTLTPTAAHGAIFEEWQNTWDSTPCSSQSGDACIITVPTSGRSVNLRPNFGPDTQQNLNLVIEGNGSGNVTSTSGGINCSSDGANAACNEIFEEGTEVTLKAVAEPGSVFLHWGGWDEWAVNPCFASEDPECTFTMYWPHTVKAIFSAENLAVVDIQPNVQLLDNSVVIYPIDVINSGTEDSGEATVDIQASAVGNGGEEISRRCDDQYNEDRGTCTKVNDDQFKITVKQGEGVRIIVSRYYGSDVNTATLGATVSYSKDADPDDNEKSVNLHRDPATLPGLRTDIRLQYYGGTSADSSERNTLVFTHGWQDTDPPECEGLEKQAMLKCFSKHLWSGKNSEKGLASALAMKNFYYIGDAPNPINEELNFTQYIWAGAFTQSGMSAEGYIQARRHVFDAGRRLGKQLIEDLGSDYSRKIHFVGHSLGTAVNAYAVRYFLDNLTEEARNNVTIQMTILDYPNRISKIGVLPAVIGLWPDLSREEQKQWGFDEYFFADVLPELDDPNKKDRLYVDNYFAAKTTPLDTKISSAGVGTAISGKNVYNHLKDSGLYDPNDVGQHLFWGENFLENFNDHSGVHQWYRWTMWPDQNEYLRGNQFVCSNGVWTKPLLLKLLDNSLNPCNTGFAHSILLEGWQPEDFPQRNGYVTDFSPAAQYDMVGGGTTQRCSMTENPLQITCSNLSAPMQPELALAADQSEPAAAAIDTASDYVHTNINLSKEIGSLSFKYRLTNTDTKEPVHLLIDGVVVWSMSAQSDTQEEWTVSGKIPVALTKGEHTLMLAFNRTSEDAEFAMQDLQFFEAPNKNGFLPAMLFLLLNK